MKRGMDRSPSPRGKYFERMPDRGPRKYDDPGRDSRPYGNAPRNNFPYRNDGGGGGNRGGPSFGAPSSRTFRGNDRPSDNRPSWGSHDAEKTERTTDFKTLFVGNLNQQVPDPQLKDALYKEFEKFGEFNVKLSYNGEEKVAYVCFRRPEDAKESKRARLRAILFDRPIYIDYATVSISGGGGGSGGGGRKRSVSPDGHRKVRGRSPGGTGSGNRMPNDYKRGDYRSPPGENIKPPSKNKEGRFPDFLTHIDPEDDPDATRTLFVGNIDATVSEEEIRHMFKKYGMVEDIDMKRQGQGRQGNPYAFVRFHDLDMAHDAKINLSGKYIGKYQLKIGFGKVHASNMVWIGGISSSVTEKDLDRDFTRFGKIKGIEKRGTTHGYILYEDMDSAKDACNKMRGTTLMGHRIRIDFNDPAKFGRDDPVPSPGGGRPLDQGPDSENRNGANRHGGDQRDPNFERNADRGGGRGLDDRGGRGGGNRGEADSRDAPRGDGAFSPRRRRSGSPGRGNDVAGKRRYPSGDDAGRHGSVKRERRDDDGAADNNGSSRRHDHSPAANDTATSAIKLPSVPSDVSSLEALVKHLVSVGDGALVLKNSTFTVRFHLVMGDEGFVRSTFDSLDPAQQRGSSGRLLKITQRLRLDQNKLDDMTTKMYSSAAGGNAVLLAMPDANVVVEDPSVNAKRPLRNLMSYLKQKEAAGVIQTSTNAGQCVLHAFPACEFSHSFLKKVAPGLGTELPKDDHLVIVLMRGTAA